jgi:signal transduction histidine kinase
MPIQQPSNTESELLRDKERAREFVSIAIHDLRGALRAIRTSSEMLNSPDGPPAPENAARYLRYIREGVERMEGLLRDIGGYVEAELRDLELREINLSMVLTEAKAECADRIKACGATIVSKGTLPTVTGDFSALVQVFCCLFDNACKFRGDADPLITIEAERRGDEWVIAVRDNGQGFKPVYADRIFDRFERLNGSQYAGSGLGLPLAKRIVEQHGGRMWAESTPGGGSAFRFTLAAEM